MASYLAEIIEYEKQNRNQPKLSFDDLLFKAKIAPRFGSFVALRSIPEFHVIAEFKRKSPSKGNIADLDVQKVVQSYEQGGASAISVLTNKKFFNGSDEDLIKARSITRLPILRKDFVIFPTDILEAKLLGATAVLLIVKALSSSQLADFLAIAKEADVEAVVEIHSIKELYIALDNNAEIIGVNRRDLDTFEINYEIAKTAAQEIPSSVFKIIESGFSSLDEIKEIKELGYEGLLVGEFLMKNPNKIEIISKIKEMGQ